MEPERRDEWAARVVAWHHRDPLALRVTPQQVGEFGWVDLPFAGGARRARWRPVFTEKVLEAVSARRLAAWARRHGQESRPEADGLPLHQVAIDRARVPEDGVAVVLWLGQATLQTPAGPVQVLLDSRPGGAVLGRRRRSRRRVAVAAIALAAVAALAGAFAWVVQRGRGDELAAPPVAAASAPVAASAASGAASSASAPAAASAPASAAASAASAPTTASSAAAASAASSASPASAAAAASSPPPKLSVAPPTPIITPRALDADGHRLREPPAFLLGDDERRAARRAGEAARAASAARRADRHEIVYALVTRASRTPAESRLLGRDLEAALGALKGTPRCPRVEVLPAGDDWRAVCWPLLKRDEAQRLRDLLVERGQRVEMIEF